ncbi:MAG: hypothetical protein HC794_03745, partial [Nitrospiraceae bacterium]|nr:hypothetical protein [Nitrospiraceae bacterium]
MSGRSSVGQREGARLRAVDINEAVMLCKSGRHDRRAVPACDTWIADKLIANAREQLAKVKVPVFSVGGWYDNYVESALQCGDNDSTITGSGNDAGD